MNQQKPAGGDGSTPTTYEPQDAVEVVTEAHSTAPGHRIPQDVLDDLFRPIVGTVNIEATATEKDVEALLIVTELAEQSRNKALAALETVITLWGRQAVDISQLTTRLEGAERTIESYRLMAEMDEIEIAHMTRELFRLRAENHALRGALVQRTAWWRRIVGRAS